MSDDLLNQYEIELERNDYKQLTVTATDFSTAVKLAELLSPGFRVVAVDDKELIAKCEACGKPIFDGDEYVPCEDVVYLCGECYHKESEAAEKLKHLDLPRDQLEEAAKRDYSNHKWLQHGDEEKPF